MKKIHDPQANSAELRRVAEARLSARQKDGASLAAAPVDTLRLIHELDVHQIELEMQNEELMESNIQIDAALRQYIDLYDYALSDILHWRKTERSAISI
jgi:hypothetical protein